VILEVRNNRLLEAQVKRLDKKIELLIKNRITLEVGYGVLHFLFLVLWSVVTEDLEQIYFWKALKCCGTCLSDKNISIGGFEHAKIIFIVVLSGIIRKETSGR
jgi:hypothetical protein